MQGIIPDSSVPITTGTVPDLGVPKLEKGKVPSTNYPKIEYNAPEQINRVYRPDEFDYSESAWGGFINNGLGAAMLASDLPTFDVQQGYDAEAALLAQEKELGYQVNDVDREHLLRSRSEGEFQYRQFQIDEKAEGLRKMSANPLSGVLGASVDADVFLGYGIGAASRVAKIGRAATAASLTVGTAAGTAGTYAYAYGDAPFSTTDAAVHVAIASSLAFLYGTGFKYAKKGSEGTPKAPASATGAADDVTGTTGTVSPNNATGASTSDMEAGLAGVGRGGDTNTINRAGMDSMDIDSVRYSEMSNLRKVRVAAGTLRRVKDAVESAFGKSAFDGVLKSRHIHVLESADQLPKALQGSAGTHVYDPLTDTVFIMGDKITKENARTVMMQGVGISVGLERTLGTATYDGLMGALEALAKKGDTNAIAAIAGAKGKDYLRAENALAAYIEKSGIEVGFVREIVAKVKAYLKDTMGVDVNLTKEDIVALVQSSTKKTLKKEQVAATDPTHVWAGSAAQFDEFDTAFVGTGEGNVLQGWGLYSASDKHVADWYRLKETAARSMSKEEGGLYRAKLKDAKSTDFLAWESSTQSPRVKAILNKAGVSTKGTGKDVYFKLMETMPGDTPLAKAKATSNYLYDLGIKGNKYPSGKAKRVGTGENNYVFFSEKNVAIDKKYAGGSEVEPLHIPSGRESNRRIVDDPDNATDADILNAIDDSNDVDFKGVL